MEKDNHSMFVTAWFLPESGDAATVSRPGAAEQVLLPSPPSLRFMTKRCCPDLGNRPLDPNTMSDMH